MAMDSSADLLFRISADPSDATANIARFRSLMSKDLEGMKADFAGWAKSIFGSVSTLQGAMTAGVAGGLAAITAMIAGGVKIGEALWDAGQKAAKYAEEIEDGTHKTGMSAEALSGLRYAAKNADLGYEELVGSLVKFSTAMVKAQKDSDYNSTAFARLGISQKDLRAGNENLLPLLYKVSDAFRTHADGMLKTAAARELFGRSGARDIEFLNLGAEALKRYADQASELGMVLTERDIIAAKAFRLELIQLNATFEGMRLQIGAGLLPLLGELTVGLEAWIKTAPKVAETYGKIEWWKGLVPGGREIAAVREGLKIYETELLKARADLAARLRAAMADSLKALPAPEGPAAQAQQDWWGLSSILEGVKTRLAGVGTEEEKIAGETAHVRYELEKAGLEFNRLHSEGKLSAETVAREMAALASMPRAVGDLARRQWREYLEKRNAAAVAATEELRTKLADQQILTWVQQTRNWDEDINKLTAQYKKKGELTKENEALIAEIREAGQRRIERDRGETFIRELQDLQRDLAAMVTAHFTAAERLAWSYEEDLKRYSEVEEAKQLLVTKLEERETLRQQFAINRQAAFQRYLTESNALAQSQGWQGTLFGTFAESIRNNERMLRDFTYGVPGQVSMVSLAFEAMNESAQRAFSSFSKGMGQNVAQAIVYSKTIREAMRSALAAALESLGAECLAQAIYSTALGFLRLAQGNPASASLAFQAAALFGVGGMSAALIGRAVAPPQSAAGGTGGSAGPGSAAASASETGTGSAAARPYIQINIAGHIVGRAGIEELTEIINEAVKDRDVRLIASQVKQARVLTV